MTTDLNGGAGTPQLALSPDGTTLAPLVGEFSSSEVAVIGLATGILPRAQAQRPD